MEFFCFIYVRKERCLQRYRRIFSSIYKRKSLAEKNISVGYFSLSCAKQVPRMDIKAYQRIFASYIVRLLKALIVFLSEVRKRIEVKT